MDILQKRGRLLKEGIAGTGPIVCWLSRDQRAKDNWALLAAQELALVGKRPLLVIFCLAPKFLGATGKQYRFMLDGLLQLQASLKEKNISFCVLRGKAGEEIPRFCKSVSAGALVADFSPLRLSKQWKKEVSRRLAIPFYEIDAHNIVPAWLVSGKQEFGAYTLRPKLRRLLPDYLHDFPTLKKHRFSYSSRLPIIDWRGLEKYIPAGNRSDFPSGEKAARIALRRFLSHGLANYNELRNDPNAHGQSGLSPYLHFGQLAPQRVALEASVVKAKPADREAFLEELIVRRELADNFCLYNDQYDSPAAFPAWAKESIKKHAKDRRDYLYSLSDFEKCATHDPLWNAAQAELLASGSMHGYMRMYWAKKILEWTPDASTALSIAIFLNDKYELDGRDPNGYAGIAWSIGGIHDRAWPERPVFGKIRYMNDAGCRRKFDVEKYIGYWSGAKR